MHILAVIAAAAGKVVSKSSLLYDVWGRDTVKKRNILKTQVSAIRQQLESATNWQQDGTSGLSIEAHLDGYRLCGALDQLDTVLFDSLVAEAADLGAAGRAACLMSALSLWRGRSAFLGVNSVVLDSEQNHLEARREEAVLVLAACELSMMRPTAFTIERVAEVFELNHARTDVTTTLAGLLARARQQDAALNVIRLHRKFLANKGNLPAVEVEELEGHILRRELAVLPSSVPTKRDHWSDQSLARLVRRPFIEDQIGSALAEGAVVLRGEAGVGKTILTDEVVRTVLRGGRQVVRVNAREDALRPVEVTANIIEELSAQFGSHVQAHLERPALAAAVERLCGDSQHAPAITRDRMITEVTSFIQSVITSVGAVLVIEDAHWLDNGTAEIVERLVIDRLPGLLLTSREAMRKFAGDWVTARTIEVPPFSEEEVLAVMRESLGERSNDYLARELHRETGGNALFLRLRLDQLADDPRDSAVPFSILHAVSSRMRRFSADTCTVLQAAALLGPSFPLAPLVKIRPRPRELLQDAVDEGLVRIDDDTRVGHFLHGLVVKELVWTMTIVERVERHDQLCRALLALEESPVAIARQALGARDLDSVRVVVCSLAAAQQQAQAFEWDEAIDWATEGITAFGEIDRTTSLDDDVESSIKDSRVEIELQLLRGQGLRRMNKSGSQENLNRAAELAEKIGNDELFVSCVTELCLHGPTTQAGTVEPVARHHLDRALCLQVDNLQRAKLLSAAATLLALSDEWGVGRERYREALNIVEAAGESEGLRIVRMNAHLGLSHPEDLDDRRIAAAELLALDDHEAQWEGNFLRVGLALIDADRLKLEQSINALRELTKVVRQRDQRRALVQMETVWAYVCGDLDEATRLADETFEISQGAFSESWARSIYAALLVPIRTAQGRDAELLPVVESLIASTPDFITWHGVAASMAYAARDRRAMRNQIDYIANHKFQFVEDLSWTAVATIVCRPIWALDDRESADVLYEMLEPYKDQMTWNGLSTHGPVAAGLGCLAATRGDTDRVAQHVSKAQDLVRELEAPHMLWPELDSLLR